MVRAKFKCISVTPNNAEADADKATDVLLQPVTSGSEENKDFFKLTPCGEIKLSTINPAAADQFIVGKDYYIDFTVAEDVVVDETIKEETV